MMNTWAIIPPFQHLSSLVPHEAQYLTTSVLSQQSQKGESSRSDSSGVASLSILGVGGGVGNADVLGAEMTLTFDFRTLVVDALA
jgi:hypothetical protein